MFKADLVWYKNSIIIKQHQTIWNKQYATPQKQWKNQRVSNEKTIPTLPIWCQNLKSSLAAYNFGWILLIKVSLMATGKSSASSLPHFVPTTRWNVTVILESKSMLKTGDLKTIQNWIQFFFNKKIRNWVHFLACILPDHMAHDILKEFWKNSHFENMTAVFLLSCQN